MSIFIFVNDILATVCNYVNIQVMLDIAAKVRKGVKCPTPYKYWGYTGTKKCMN